MGDDMSFEKMSSLHSETSRITGLGVICEMFRGSDGGSAIVSIRRTPGGRGRHAIVTINPAAAAKVAVAVSERRMSGSYHDDPASYEHDARLSFLSAVPEMISATMFAKTADATILEIRGLPAPAVSPPTPRDGVVVESEVRGHVFNLVGSLTGSLNLCGFSYASENRGRLLRAVSPVPQLASQASSQGFADDLGWHQDNANRSIAASSEPSAYRRGPMNDYQAFVCVHPDEHVPMDVASLDDIVGEVSQRHGSVLVDILHRPEFAICSPASHGGDRDVEEVPLLVRDDRGVLRGRFHAANVIGLSVSAQAAYDAFRDVAGRSRCSAEIDGETGALLLYDNTRMMHRRRRFEPRFDGQDRYYIRLYMMDADRMVSWRHCMHERVFA